MTDQTRPAPPRPALLDESDVRVIATVAAALMLALVAAATLGLCVRLFLWAAGIGG